MMAIITLEIPDNNKSRLMLRDLGLELYNSVDSIKSTVRNSLAGIILRTLYTRMVR